MGEVKFEPGDVVVYDHRVDDGRHERSLWVVIEHACRNAYVHVRQVHAVKPDASRAVRAHDIRHATVLDLASLRQHLDELINRAVELGTGKVRDT